MTVSLLYLWKCVSGIISLFHIDWTKKTALDQKTIPRGPSEGRGFPERSYCRNSYIGLCIMDEVRVHTPKAVTCALPKDRGLHAEFFLGLKLAFALSTGWRAQRHESSYSYLRAYCMLNTLLAPEDMSKTPFYIVCFLVNRNKGRDET